MLFVADLENLTWRAHGDLGHYSSTVDIGFVRGSEVPVLFRDLSFSYTVYYENSVILQNSFPPEGVTYKSSDQEFLVSDNIDNIVPESKYIIDLFATESGNEIKTSIELFSPRLPQPFPSWIYDDQNKMWIAPKSPPTDGKKYIWNELEQGWEAL